MRLLFAALLLPACAFTQRPLLMKEMEPALPAKNPSSLAGKKVFVKVVDQRVDIGTKWTETEPTEPGKDYKFKKMSDEARKAWDAELDEIKARTKEADWHKVGWLRNGFGAHTADVWTVNPAPEWMRQVLELELKGRGATVTTSEGGADLVVTATMRYLKVDVYWSYWCDLVVDFDVQRRGRETTRKTLHTHGGFTAWSSSSYEFYQSIRDTEQKMMWLLFEDLEALMA